MSVAFLSLRPMRVLADRSHDVCNGWAMAVLAPAAVFQTTDNRKPLTDQLLRGYDLVSTVGLSATAYTVAELGAIEKFVQRGGTLVLASSAGHFCLANGDGPAALAHNAIAARFGYRFEEPAGLPADQTGLRGFEREQLAFTTAGRALHLEAGDLPVGRPGWLTVPEGAQVLLTGGEEKRPVIAWSQHGKGKVLVCHDLGMFSSWNGFVACHFVALVDPSGRVKQKDRPVALIEYPEIVKRQGKIRLTMTAPTQSRHERALKIAQRILPIAVRLVPPHKPLKEWSIGLETGCSGWGGWGEVEYLDSHVGVDQNDASLAATLTGQIVDRLLWSRFGWQMRTFVPTMASFLVDQVLRELGDGEFADMQVAALRNHPTFAPTVDFSRIYSEVDRPASVKWLWFELGDEFGRDYLTRMVRLLPEKNASKHIDWRLYRELDVVAFLLAHVVGPKAYAFLRKRGHTVREIPLKKPGSDGLGKAIGKALERLVADPTEPASDRYDAACILADRMGEEVKNDDKVATKLNAQALPERLAAAVRLAQRRDSRSIEPLRALLPHEDAGIRAIAALALVSEAGDQSACDPLLAAAPGMDTRFQLAAGYALTQAGDPRGATWSFKHHPACSVKLHGRGQIRANPCVDGYEVCNVYSQPMIRPTQYGGGFSVYYVDWVHTQPRWRRRGIARVGMDAGLNWHWDKDCAMTSLHTGTRNVAHALYRDYGLADYARNLRFEKVLRKEEVVAPPKGVSISLANGTGKLEYLAFVNQQQTARPDHVREIGGWPERRVAVHAVQGGKTIGFAAANISRDGKSAGLELLAVDEPKMPKEKKPKKSEGKKKPDNPYSPREHVGQAVLSRLHAELVKKGVRKIDSHYWRPFGEQETPWLLRRSGYGSQLAGGVELYRLNSLEQFLSEALPTLQGRLAKAKKWQQWNGHITLRGGEQVACICVDHGKVSVCAPSSSAAPEITITGALPAIQRLAMGVTSAFDEFYQVEASIEPMLNDQVTELLDALFPRLTLEV